MYKEMPDPFGGNERKKRKRRAYLLGLGAEWAAVLFLACTGHKILARRQRTAGGEADIVARRGRALVLCEVKFRRRFADASSSVSLRQRQRLVQAGRHVLRQYGRPGDSLRFDLMAFGADAWPRYLKDAFRPEGRGGF
jgi:putative endonuclease